MGINKNAIQEKKQRAWNKEQGTLQHSSLLPEWTYSAKGQGYLSLCYAQHRRWIFQEGPQGSLRVRSGTILSPQALREEILQHLLRYPLSRCPCPLRYWPRRHQRRPLQEIHH